MVSVWPKRSILEITQLFIVSSSEAETSMKGKFFLMNIITRPQRRTCSFLPIKLQEVEHKVISLVTENPQAASFIQTSESNLGKLGAKKWEPELAE